MQKTNVEIEFKTSISKEKYQELLKLFELEDNVFKQTNFYFDTDNLDLNNEKIVLRIRQNGERYKVTMKRQSPTGAFENHVLLKKEQALEMIKNGFNTSDFYDNINYFVTFKASLDNYRVSTPYKEGTLFLDRCHYHDVIDYEIEYEVDEFEQGQKRFNNFLNEHNIEFVKTKRKSERALTK
ncbi:MAG: CYTH domain-containing protein [Acholeplasma sp.]|nr:CYTH domain-containing protein [Acholeplasma sp.]